MFIRYKKIDVDGVLNDAQKDVEKALSRLESVELKLTLERDLALKLASTLDESDPKRDKLMLWVKLYDDDINYVSIILKAVKENFHGLYMNWSRSK